MSFTIHGMFGLINVKLVIQKFDNVGIQNLNSKLPIIFSGLYSTKLIILKPAYMFFRFIIT